MKTLLTLISLLLNFAIPAGASPEKTAALVLYQKITGIQVAAQRYATTHSYSHSGITMPALCTYQNISGVCGKNKDGFYTTEQYSIEQGLTTDKFIIKVHNVPYKVGKATQALFNQRSSACTTRYETGVITATCIGIADRFLSCERACASTSGDLTGAAFMSCLSKAVCTNIGITTDASTPSTNLEGFFNPISLLGKYPNLNAGYAVLANVAACHASVTAAGTNYTNCAAAFATSACSSAGVTFNSSMPWVGDCLASAAADCDTGCAGAGDDATGANCFSCLGASSCTAAGISMRTISDTSPANLAACYNVSSTINTCASSCATAGSLVYANIISSGGDSVNNCYNTYCFADATCIGIGVNQSTIASFAALGGGYYSGFNGCNQSVACTNNCNTAYASGAGTAADCTNNCFGSSACQAIGINPEAAISNSVGNIFRSCALIMAG